MLRNWNWQKYFLFSYRKLKKELFKNEWKVGKKIYLLVYTDHSSMNWIYNVKKKNPNFTWKYFVRSGSIFNTTFISNLLKPHEDLPEHSSQFKKVLQSIQEEAVCSHLDVSETNGDHHQRDLGEPEAKRPKIEHSQHPTTTHPPFYINLHKMKFKDVIIPK